MATYALCGFANFSSIAIQIGGIGPLAPERKKRYSFTWAQSSAWRKPGNTNDSNTCRNILSMIDLHAKYKELISYIQKETPFNPDM